MDATSPYWMKIARSADIFQAMLRSAGEDSQTVILDVAAYLLLLYSARKTDRLGRMFETEELATHLTEAMQRAVDGIEKL